MAGSATEPAPARGRPRIFAVRVDGAGLAHRFAVNMLIPAERVESKIYRLRGARVMLSPDLARLYGVEPRALTQAVMRNRGRFPPDFMFQLNDTEVAILKSQIVISSWGGRRRANPYAFTEQGVAMLSSVLRSARAVQVNIDIMRAFVRMREVLASQEALAGRLALLERKYDAQFKVVFRSLRRCLLPARRRQPRRIGF